MIFRPLISRSTYRGWAWLILGGGVLLPYMMVGTLVGYSWRDPDSSSGTLLIDPIVFVAVLPVVAVTGLVLPLRTVQQAIARGLLDAGVPDAEGAMTWARRWRDAVWYTIHLGLGGMLSGVSLALVPFSVFVIVLPLFPGLQEDDGLVQTGWPVAAGPVLGPVFLVSLVYLIAGARAMLRRLARSLLGPTPADREAAERNRMVRLATRNRIARELHDSVGHALSVVAVQAAAAGRVLDRDPRFARQAMTAVEETARHALAELDLVLGVLREEGTGDDHSPLRTMADLQALLWSSPLTVRAEVEGDLADLPDVVSREAYRIVQESCTNAVKHGADADADLAIRVTRGELSIEFGNRIDPRARQARLGRGVTGMSERAGVLGGRLTAGPEDGRWIVRAVLPLRSAS